MSSEALLSVRDVTVRFGGITALDTVSFDVARGGVCGLIGPNGAGKTTLFNCLSRLYSYESGDILFEGQSITDVPVHRMASIGIGRTFQNLAMFATMSVRQNIMVGAHCRSHAGFASSFLALPRVRVEEQGLTARADELMRTFELGRYAEHPVGALPFGIQKRVEFARALAAEPKLLLLDEPAVGLNHEELGELADIIRMVTREFQLTILLVEHHMELVMEVSNHIVVLNFGAKIAEGSPAQVQSHPEVIAAYLGTAQSTEAA